MHRWSPLNDRQLALLSRIGEGADPVTSASPELATTALALKNRGLVIMPRHNGKWQAEITEQGRFYLEQGHHPDRPERPRRGGGMTSTPEPNQADAAPPGPAAARPVAAKSTPTRASKPPAQSPTEVGAALIARVQKAGRFLRIPDPGGAERARYRREFDAARQCAPEGYRLNYTGRNAGDIVFGLLRDTGQDETRWNEIRLARTRVAIDTDDVIAAVTADHSAFDISEAVLHRVLRLLRLMAEQAASLGDGGIAIHKKKRQQRPLVTVHGQAFAVTFVEGRKSVPYVPEQPGKRLYDWQRVIPEQRLEPSGELELRVILHPGHGHVGQGHGWRQGWEEKWSDTAKKPLEEQIGTIIRALSNHTKNEERARQAQEAEQQRIREKREQQERDRREREEREHQEARQREAAEKELTRQEWEAAVSVATIKATQAARARQFGAALEAWRTAAEIRSFCEALDEHAAASGDDSTVERLTEWSAWGRKEADRLDATAGGRALAGRNLHAAPTDDELRPYLDGWHPQRPEKEQPPQREATPPPPPSSPPTEPARPDPWRSLIDERRNEGWRHGRPGRAQWWRR